MMKTKRYRIIGMAIIVVALAFFTTNTYSQRVKPFMPANERPATLYAIDDDDEPIQNFRLSSVVTQNTSEGVNVSFRNPTGKEAVVSVYDQSNNLFKEFHFPPTKQLVNISIKLINPNMIKHIEVRTTG